MARYTGSGRESIVSTQIRTCITCSLTDAGQRTGKSPILTPHSALTKIREAAFEAYRPLEKEGTFIATVLDFATAEERLDAIVDNLEEDYSSAWSEESEIDDEKYV